MYWKPWNVKRGCQTSVPLPFADVGVRGAGAAQVGGVDCAVGIEPLGEPQRDLLARLAAHLQARDAGEVLAEVEHEHARLRLGDGPGAEFLDGAHGRPGMRLHQRMHLVAADVHRSASARRQSPRRPIRDARAGRRRSRPCRKSASSIGPVVAFHSGPVATSAVEPSAYSRCSWARTRVYLP